MSQAIRFLVALALVLVLGPKAEAQCTGVFPPNTVCGNPQGTGAPPRAMTFTPAGVVITPTQFGASGSNSAFTGTVAAGSNTLTLTAVTDFANGHGIRVNGAGPPPIVGPVTGVTVTAGDTVPGTGTYQYQVASFDANCGISTPSAPVSLPNRPAVGQYGALFNGHITGTTLTVETLQSGTVTIGQLIYGPGVAANTVIVAGSGTTWTVSVSQTVANGTYLLSSVYAYNQVAWTAPSGSAPVGYIIYGRSAGGMSLMGFTANTEWFDIGQNFYADTANPLEDVMSRPDWAPLLPPTAPVPQCLITAVTAGGSTSTLTLAAAASTAVTAGGVHHDDVAAFQGALGAAAGGALYIPTGNYQFHSGLTITSGVRVYGDGMSGDAGNEYVSQVPLDCGDTRLVATRLCFDVAATGFNAVTDSPVSFQNLSIIHPHWALEGTSGIRIASTSAANSNNTQSYVDHVLLMGQFVAVSLMNALSADVTNSHMVALTGGGVDVNTPATNSFSFTHLLGNRVFGIPFWESHFNQFTFCFRVLAGGDLRIANNKCNSGGPNTAGIFFWGQGPGASQSQSIEPVNISNNSLEGQNVGILFSQHDPSVCGNQVTISGNQTWSLTGLLINRPSSSTNCGFGMGRWMGVMSITGNSFGINGFGVGYVPGEGQFSSIIDGAASISYVGNTHACNFVGCAVGSAGLAIGAVTQNIVAMGNTYTTSFTNKVVNEAPATALNLDYDDGYPGALNTVSVPSPGALTFTTAPPQMEGVKGSVTPVVSGKVSFTLSGDFTAGGATPFGCAYAVVLSSIGTAPNHGDPVPGGVINGTPVVYRTTSANNLLMGLDGVGVATGLTLGTTYWYDALMQPYTFVSGATCTANNISIVAKEL